MKSSFLIENPGEVEATMQITMKLKEWEALKKQLESNKTPSWELRDQIANLVTTARDKFYAGHGG